MSNGTMTPEQALANVDGVCAQFAGNRQQHVLLQQSVAVIAQVIAAIPKPAEPAAVTGEIEKDVEPSESEDGPNPA